MATFILILSLVSGNGGTHTTTVEFTGENAEVKCEKAAEKWEKRVDSFSIEGRAICVLK
ncbi:hypothetical protein AU156_gp032 [Edwardsiella phage PEi20]|uniref:Uncharacterized protein n=2 Tax=Kanagawavirus pei20 TaxID=2844109 RepID=A0A0B6VP43_9CAUD|nr:hypothetical protein AU156_gp032 [Edwardsiella phage PEi20]BAQ22682.1 conserved hypothetical protein [Edwardsiella phage PEi20]BAQ22983.1 conserved hypothetical protein [Edwardsiella phage PEi26]